MTSATVLHGDCLDHLRAMPSGSVDALVTDPPAGISFMGKDWDHHKGGRGEWVAWMADVMAECLRVLKPGAYGLVWALPRTSHWTATALEDAGFEVRDCIVHLFGTGFPKGKHALKPASEHWWLVRKPLAEKSVAANVSAHGVGGLNIDGCRIPGPRPASGWAKYGSKAGPNSSMSGANYARAPKPDDPRGRWPANVILSEEAAAEVDRQSGTTTSRSGVLRRGATTGQSIGGSSAYRAAAPRVAVSAGHNDTGGASRFFYTPKAPTKERPVAPDGTRHPTVKSVALMRWLCRLVTPPGGVILDPFAGSGATLEAAALEGFSCIGIEREDAYVSLIEQRLARLT